MFFYLPFCVSSVFLLPASQHLHTVVGFQVFLSNTNNLHILVRFLFPSDTNNFEDSRMVSSIPNTNSLHKVSWFPLLQPDIIYKIYINKGTYEGHTISFQTFFVWALSLTVHQSTTPSLSQTI